MPPDSSVTKCTRPAEPMKNKKLWRAANEPARVYARRDFDPKSAEPLLLFVHNRKEYYSPGYPTWMFLGGDKVTERAIMRYGCAKSQIRESIFDPIGGIVDINPDGSTEATRVDGLTFPAWYLKDQLFPGTPIAYGLRRWNDQIQWKVDGVLLRGVVGGEVVACIRSLNTAASQF
jgi:hypothetical protein